MRNERRALVLALLLLTVAMVLGGLMPRSSSTTPLPYIEGEVLLKFQPWAGDIDRSAVQAALAADRLRTFRSGAQHRRIGRGLTVEEALELLRRNTAVLYAEPNYYVTLAELPNDPRFAEQWGLRNTGHVIPPPPLAGQAGSPGADVNAEEAWEVTTGNHSVIVAVLDSGVDTTHPDLSDNLIDGWDFIDEDDDPFPYKNPPGAECEVAKGNEDHGTHVSGIIGAVGDNGIGISGVNWDVSIMPIRMASGNNPCPQGGCTPPVVADAVAAVDFAAANGADVINASWHNSYGYSQLLRDTIEQAGQDGVVFVTVAMNAGKDIDAPGMAVYPASYDLDNIITLAATDNQDQMASFSNFGAISIDLGAPEVQTLTTTATIVPTCEPNEDGILQPGFAAGPHYEHSGGTSMAAPHVSGTLALMRALDPDATVAELKCRLLTTADPLPSLIFRTKSGGRLNARRAIDSLLEGGPCTEPENFQFTASIYGSPNPNYPQINLISLPYGNVFQGPGGPEALCQAFDLSVNAVVAQYDSAGNRLEHECGSTSTFELLDRKGVEIIEKQPGIKQGIIEGWDVPGAAIVIDDLGAGKIGYNLFPVRYNGKARTPEDLCGECELSNQAMITRFNAANGTVQSHMCGQLSLWNLVMGEAVLIQEPNGPVTCEQPAY